MASNTQEQTGPSSQDNRHLASFINATKNRESSTTVIQNQEARSSTSSKSLSIAKRIGGFVLNLMILSLVVVLFVINLPTIRGLITSILNLAFTLLGIPINGITGISSEMLSLWFLAIIVFLFYSALFMRDRLKEEFEVAIILSLLPFVFYYIFIVIANRYFPLGFNEFTQPLLPFIILALGFIYMFIIGGLSSPGSIQHNTSKFTEYLIISLLILGVILFFSGGSLQAQTIGSQVDEEVDEVQSSLNSFGTYWNCEVLGGRIRGSSECLEVKEEVVVKKGTNEVFSLNYRKDSSSNVVHPLSKDVRFVFDIDVPSKIKMRLKDFTCFVDDGDSIKTYPLPEKYAQLSIEVPSQVTIALECPVYDVVDSRKDLPLVAIRLDFYIEDRITQFIPFVNCNDSFFNENPNILCERLGEEYFKGNIDDPRVRAFLSSIDDNVLGAYSTNTKVTGLRGNLPLYLNSERVFTLDKYDYSINFKEERGFEIEQILLGNMEVPQYIQLSENIEKNYSNVNDEVSIRMDINVVDFNSDFIGGSQPLTIDYTVYHQYKTSDERIFVRRPDEGEGDSSTISDIVANEDENSEVDQESQDDDSDENDGELQSDADIEEENNEPIMP